jgi:hypothetical protein
MISAYLSWSGKQLVSWKACRVEVLEMWYFFAHVGCALPGAQNGTSLLPAFIEFTRQDSVGEDASAYNSDCLHVLVDYAFSGGRVKGMSRVVPRLLKYEKELALL